jgi:hypothetical protein
MRKIWRGVLIFSGIVVSVPLIILLLIHLTPAPPTDEMRMAREALAKAERNNADIYSKRLFTEAKTFYDSALMDWQKQNKRFLYARNYKKVVMYAEMSSKKAIQATENSVNTTLNLKQKVKQKIESLNDLVSDIDSLFSTYPLKSEIRNRISKGKLMLKEAEVLYANGQYFKANRKMIDSEYLLTVSYDNASADLKNYFKSYTLWKKWIDKTLNDSRKAHDYSIIIDKFSRKCFIYLGGTKKYEFNAELGTNWVGNKRLGGDKATPEGMYKITKKIEGSRTKYYKALLLDYPNDEDKKRFKSEIEKGSLPSYATIGGLIEIHGDGGKGIDWTEGCIALTDKEMDLVYKIAKTGTPVTIVGSMVDLQSIMNR